MERGREFVKEAMENVLIQVMMLAFFDFYCFVQISRYVNDIMIIE